MGNLAKWDFKDKMPRKYVESFEFCFLALSHRLDQISVLIGDGIDAALYWCVCEHLFCVCVCERACVLCVCMTTIEL